MNRTWCGERLSDRIAFYIQKIISYNLHSTRYIYTHQTYDTATNHHKPHQFFN